MAVETNFVLEIALAQEQVEAANAILERAERGAIELAVPSFSLAEPFSTITNRDRDRKRLSRTLEVQADDLRRSTLHQQDATVLDSARGVLDQTGEQEASRLVVTVERILAVATVIHIDLPVFQRAMLYRSTYGLLDPDAMIFAAIVSHVAARPHDGPHYFVSKNSKDFGTAPIAAELSRFDCAYVAAFTTIVAGESRHDQRTIECLKATEVPLP